MYHRIQNKKLLKHQLIRLKLNLYIS